MKEPEKQVDELIASVDVAVAEVEQLTKELPLPEVKPHEPEKKVILLTTRHLKARQYELDRKHCYVRWSAECMNFGKPAEVRKREVWWMTSDGQVLGERATACKFAVGTIMSHRYVRQGGVMIVELADQELAEALSKTMARCPIADLLSDQLLRLAMIAPDNNQIRAHICNELNKLPPPEVVGYESLRDWIEENCSPEIPTAEQVIAAGDSIADAEYSPFGSILLAPPLRAEQVAPPPGSVSAKLRLSYNEHGRCNYSRGMWGTVVSTLTSQHMREIVEGCPDDLAAVLDNVRDEITSNVWELQCDFEVDDDGIDTSDCEGDEQTDQEVQVRNEASLQVHIKEWVRANMPEKARAIGIL